MSDGPKRVINLDADPVNANWLRWVRRKKAAPAVLLGQAVGDALGAPVEFDSPAVIAPQRERLEAFPGGGPFGWAPGEFTDDTQMAVVLARHLVTHGGIEAQALAVDFAAWATHRATADVGVQTRTVLDAVSRGETWEAATAGLSPDAAGNGSLMRAAPAILASMSPDDAADLAAQQSLVTHPNRLCVDACRVFARLVWHSIMLSERPTAEHAARLAQEPEVRDALAALASDEPPTMSGYVVHTLAGAVWAVEGSQGFEDAVWRAVSLGRDADTVAAVAGALAGAVYGLDAIPAAWRERVTSNHPLFEGASAAGLTALAESLVEVGMQRARGGRSG